MVVIAKGNHSDANSMSSGQKLSGHNYPVKCTLGGAMSDLWLEFIQHFGNITELNN